MSAELLQLPAPVLVTGLVCVALVAAVVAVQWGRTAREQARLDFAREMLAQGYSAEDVDRLIADRTPPRKGLLEQYGALSGGTRFGLWFLALVALGQITSLCHMLLRHH